MLRRTLALALALATGLTTAVVAAGDVQAAPPRFSGRIVDSWTGEPVAGATVVATDTSGTEVPGSSVVTGADGSFLLPVLDGEEYGLRVDARPQFHERGYVGAVGSQPVGRRVLQGWEEAMTFAPMSLGKIGVDGRLFLGQVVDNTTGTPLSGVTVSATDTMGVVVPGTAVVTDALGRFRIAGNIEEEHGLRLDGNAVGRERGWLGGLQVQPIGKPVGNTWGDASTWAPGKLGVIGLDRIRAPFLPPA